MARAKQKTQKVGFGVTINRTGETGAKNWEGVGFLFNSRGEAEAYRSKTYPNVKKFRIEGVRVNVEPLVAPTGRDNQERS